MKALHCPNCQANVEFEPGSVYTHCPYCGAQLYLDDEGIHIHYHDEAKILELKLKEEERLRQEESKRKYHEIREQLYENEKAQWNLWYENCIRALIFSLAIPVVLWGLHLIEIKTGIPNISYLLLFAYANAVPLYMIFTMPKTEYKRSEFIDIGKNLKFVALFVVHLFLICFLFA